MIQSWNLLWIRFRADWCDDEEIEEDRKEAYCGEMMDMTLEGFQMDINGTCELNSITVDEFREKTNDMVIFRKMYCVFIR